MHKILRFFPLCLIAVSLVSCGEFVGYKDDSVDALVHAVMSNTDMWGQDLTAIPGFEAAVAQDLALIRKEGALAAYRSCL